MLSRSQGKRSVTSASASSNDQWLQIAGDRKEIADTQRRKKISRSKEPVLSLIYLLILYTWRTASPGQSVGARTRECVNTGENATPSSLSTRRES